MKIWIGFLVGILAFPFLLLADKCALRIEGNDMMKFNLTEMEAPRSCGEVTVTLVHTGKLPRNSMGHNWVLVKTEDINAVGAAAMGAGLDNEYVPPGDARILAATKVIGGGEETSVTVDLSKLDSNTAYSFVCTFPGHFALMKGAFKVV